MTKEESIEKCKEIIQQNKEIVKQARLSKDTNAIELTANCNKESIAIETVLNILEEKNAEIEKYKKLLADNLAKGLNNSLQAKQKANTDLEDLNEGWKIELKKKDKVIDLMAKYIADIDNEDICFEIENKYCNKNMDYGECEDCIKQYFERKVEDECKR